MYIDNEFTDSKFWADAQYEGSAHFFLLSEDYTKLKQTPAYRLRMSPSTKEIISETRINIDLLMTAIVQPYAEYDQIIPYIGDVFSHYFYGANPMILNVSGYLVDTMNNIGKLEMMELYRWLFRISRVAKTGIAPYLTFTGVSAQGAMLNLDINESGSMQDMLEVRFRFLVFSMRLLSPLNEKVKDNKIDFSKYNDVVVV